MTLLFKIQIVRNSLVVQWLGLSAFTAKGAGSIPGRGTKIPHAAQCGQKNKKYKIQIVNILNYQYKFMSLAMELIFNSQVIRFMK